MLNSGRVAIAILLAVALTAGPAPCAEEAIRTPSDQMKDAVGKLGKTPATIGQSLQDLTDAAKEKLREAFGGEEASKGKIKPLDLNVPRKKIELKREANPKLNDANRDPFRPMTLRSRAPVRRRENLSPLERYELTQLKLVGIVWSIHEPRALVEDSTGLGYMVRVGTPIGSNDGKIKAIHQDQIIVEEHFEDAYGARKKRDVPMRILTQ